MPRKLIVLILAFVLAACSGGSSPPPSPAPLPGPPPPHVGYIVGYIGCSNTADAVNGYHATTGNKNLIWASYSTGSGAIAYWADPTSSYWTLYKEQIQSYGQPQKVWVQLCESTVVAGSATYAQVKQILVNLKAISPSAVAYISAINEYNPAAGLCSVMGPTGAGETDTQTWAAQAVADGLAKPGPNMGPLTAALVDPDGCHPNAAGNQLLGTELVQFFDQ